MSFPPPQPSESQEQATEDTRLYDVEEKARALVEASERDTGETVERPMVLVVPGQVFEALRDALGMKG